jgi:hypothetical protein
MTKPVLENDIFTDREGNSELPLSNYADSLLELFVRKGEYWTKTIIYNSGLDDGISDKYQSIVDTDGTELRYLRFEEGRALDLLKIDRSQIVNPLRYMNDNFPLVSPASKRDVIAKMDQTFNKAKI